MTKYYMAGDRGLVGTHYHNYKPDSVGGNTSTVEYENKLDTYNHIIHYEPSHLIINAATVGGLQEDLDLGFELTIKNLTIQNNLFSTASSLEIERVLLQGSVCSFPESAQQPFVEEQIEHMMGIPYAGYLPTAMPKIMGMIQCKIHNDRYGSKWKTAINTNLFGPNDRTGRHAHVVGALIYKFIEAVNNDLPTVEIWGGGSQTRDILYIHDAITAMDIVLNNDKYDVVNIASGMQITIKALARWLQEISGYKGKLWFNPNRPEGMQTRMIDNTRLKSLGWEQKYSLRDALDKTYRWNYDEATKSN